MLRSLLWDAAVAAAKSHGHGQVEARHVYYAIARRLRGRAQGEALLQRAKAALEPRGDSHAVPEPTPEATALLDSLANDEQAHGVLLQKFPPGGDTVPARDTNSHTQAAASATPVAEAAPPPSRTPASESTTAILAELDSLIGLAQVKEQVRNVIAVVQANQERRKAGLAPINSSMHLVFTGPPGTGKTTVARLISRLYAAIGALPGGNFVEASRHDLVAAYVGQTAIKTSEVIGRARPGVLFIDEAYSLTQPGNWDFGAEAIATLVKGMEDHRDELAVIVAGYRAEMAEFVSSNPGLRSRLKTYVEFPDYHTDELTRIFERLVTASGIGLEAGALETAADIFERAAKKPDFGNARFARSLFEDAYARMAYRAAADGVVTMDEIRSIGPEDLVWNDRDLASTRKRIGFTPESP